jgi:class 3 adenylate cyclase
MFCDLVGSTSIAARMGAEDWRNLVGAYLDVAEAAVTALGGHVLKRLGDGLMALFGHPHAQENNSERRVRATPTHEAHRADLVGTGKPPTEAVGGKPAGTATEARRPFPQKDFRPPRVGIQCHPTTDFP